MIEGPAPDTKRARIHAWQWIHNSFGFDLIRMLLGTALLVRGIWFAIDNETMIALAGERAIQWTMYYAIAGHIAGGFFLLIGLFTRMAAFIQVPILVVAVFFVDYSQGFASANQSLELSSLVLMLLCVILVFGPGRWSLDFKRSRFSITENSVA
jgi:putative oxidoreductase